MLIKRLEVKGFKSLRDVVWEPGPLTVIIGPNGSGKTNIIKALDFLSNFAMGQLENTIKKLGGTISVFWDGDENNITFKSTIDPKGYSSDSTIEQIQHNIELEQQKNIFSYYVLKEELYKHVDNKNIEIFKRDAHRSTLTIDGQDASNELLKSKISTKESIISKITDSDDIDSALSDTEMGLTCIFPYHQIDTSSSADLRRPSVTKHEKYVDSDGQNLVSVLHTLYSESKDFENDINTAMRAAFGDNFNGLAFPPVANQFLQLGIHWKSLKHPQPIFDLSDGTIRFLFLMAVLCNPEPPSLIAIDEPETGLHPSMFPIIAEYAAEASKRTQVIFSTHSPQFLDAFGDFDVTTTVTAWRDGETTVKNLDGGALRKWLEHYSLGSLFLSGDLEALA